MTMTATAVVLQDVVQRHPCACDRARCKCRYAMDYTVAVDENQDLESTLLGPAGVRGIPHAFVVDAAGFIRYSGHPADPQFATVVEQCLAAAVPAKVRVFPRCWHDGGGRPCVSSRRIRVCLRGHVRRWRCRSSPRARRS
jgi:hypothetical protein